MNGWDAYEAMLDAMGADTLLDELARALADNELLECMQWIARMNDIELDEDEE